MTPDISLIFDHMCRAVRQGGVIAKNVQGKVQNEGKVMEIDAQASDRVRAMVEAKTVVDEVVQEVMLLTMSEVLDPAITLLDAEEKTPRAQLFSSADQAYSLVVDPIDGTLEYVEGKDAYSVTLGVMKAGQIAAAIVYLASRDQAFVWAPDGHSYLCKGFDAHGFATRQLITLPEKAKKVVYKNRRVTPEVTSGLSENGYEVVEEMKDNGCFFDAIFKVMNGEAAGYITHTPQIRDIFLAAIIGNAQGGVISDWQGQPLVWPSKGRLAEGLFVNEAYQKEILSHLNQL
ncbi:MAG TPA: inositol monophosphatase family protein [Vitreimonas sp.]|nr:inositol monophosphatase family protein [Vitreimonas sp.]